MKSKVEGRKECLRSGLICMSKVHMKAVVVWVRMSPIGEYLWNSHTIVALPGRIRLCALVVVGVSLLEEVCHEGWALWFQGPKPGTISSWNLKIQILNSQIFQHHICLYASILLAEKIINSTFETISMLQLNAFVFNKSCWNNKHYDNEYTPRV